MNQEILTLRKDSSLLDEVLATGEVIRHGEIWNAVPREVLRSGQIIESVIFEVLPNRFLARPHLGKILWSAVRPESLTFTLMPCLAVLCWGWTQGWSLNGFVALAALVGVLCLQISVNAFNDVEDYLRLVDLPGTLNGGALGSPRGRGAIQRGWISAKKLRQLGVLFLVLGLISGLPAVLQGGQLLSWIGLAAIVGVTTHSNRPIGMKYRAFGDLSIFILLGTFLTLGFCQAAFQKVDGPILVTGIFFGLLAWASSLVKQIQTLGIEKIEGISNLARVLGFKKTRFLLTLIYGVSWLILIAKMVPGHIDRQSINVFLSVLITAGLSAYIIYLFTRNSIRPLDLTLRT